MCSGAPCLLPPPRACPEELQSIWLHPLGISLPIQVSVTSHLAHTSCHSLLFLEVGFQSYYQLSLWLLAIFLKLYPFLEFSASPKTCALGPQKHAKGKRAFIINLMFKKSLLLPFILGKWSEEENVSKTPTLFNERSFEVRSLGCFIRTNMR